MPTPEDDEKTRIIRRPPPRPNDDETATVGRKKSGHETPSAPDESDEMTRLVGPPRRAAKPGAQEETQPAGDAEDPVVGWLVVLAGPGRGGFVKVGYGQNSLGRDSTERCRIDFGDASISRSKQCFVIYEPRKREFILRPGDSANLTYLNGDLVSEPRPLPPGAHIEIGKTTLLFVPLCGPKFDWEDEQPKPAAKT